jgi:phosphoglycerate dehydrogenase-like enzyme
MAMNTSIWTNTATLDGFIDGIATDASPQEAHVALIGSKPLPIDEMPNLRGIFRCGVGTDNIPFEACRDRDIDVCLPSDTTVEIIHAETANFAAHRVLEMLYRDIGDVETWVKTPRPFLGTRRVLVVGTGRIGSQVAAKLGALVEVVTYDAATDSPDLLESLLGTVDCVTLHVPLNDATRGWVDASWLSKMRDGAALVNTARGAVVEEAALLAEIESGRLTAAFDVYWQEPYHGPLRAHHPAGFLMSPHVASTCSTFLERLAGDFRTFLGVLERAGAKA